MDLNANVHVTANALYAFKSISGMESDRCVNGDFGTEQAV